MKIYVNSQKKIKQQQKEKLKKGRGEIFTYKNKPTNLNSSGSTRPRRSGSTLDL